MSWNEAFAAWQAIQNAKLRAFDDARLQQLQHQQIQLQAATRLLLQRLAPVTHRINAVFQTLLVGILGQETVQRLARMRDAVVNTIRHAGQQGAAVLHRLGEGIWNRLVVELLGNVVGSTLREIRDRLVANARQLAVFFMEAVLHASFQKVLGVFQQFRETRRRTSERLKRLGRRFLLALGLLPEPLPGLSMDTVDSSEN